MTTRKLKNFEFAGFKHSEIPNLEGLSTFDTFETPNGFVFLAAGSDQPVEGPQQVSEIISERVRYYLENDQPGDPMEATRNALVYANGYIFEKARKETGFKPGRASVICVLVQAGKAYYTWFGEVSLFLYTGKRRYPLNWPVKLSDTSNDNEFLYLGQNQMAEPGVCEQALVPVDGDMLFLGTGPGWNGIREKNFCGILSDSMPTHTKVQRMAQMIAPEHAEAPNTALLVSFYNLDQTDRSFAAGEAPAEPSIIERLRSKIDERPKSSIVKSVLIAVGFIIIAYMVYDIFLFNPTKPVRVVSETPLAQVTDSISEISEPAAGIVTETKPAPPADIQYTVRRGDTWGRIYQQYEVCSWFIRNHTQNAGKFDSADNPILNTIIIIPVKYSGSRRLNPNYYKEFTTDKVGNACQNVNETFKSRADEKFGPIN